MTRDAKEDAIHGFKKAVNAGLSSMKAARAGRCGEAMDDLVVSIAAHQYTMAEAGPRLVYTEGPVEKASKEAWRTMQSAKMALEDHCLINRTGHGLAGPPRKRRRSS